MGVVWYVFCRIAFLELKKTTPTASYQKIAVSIGLPEMKNVDSEPVANLL